ncbi:hypothetical protein [Oenococcus phage Vinitor-27]|nr:hypothetical protein [Oenococcus phage Vinitor-27]
MTDKNYEKMSQKDVVKAHKMFEFFQTAPECWLYASNLALMLDIKKDQHRTIRKYVQYLKTLDPKKYLITSIPGHKGYIYTFDPEIFAQSAKVMTHEYMELKRRADLDGQIELYLKGLKR